MKTRKERLPVGYYLSLTYMATVMDDPDGGVVGSFWDFPGCDARAATHEELSDRLASALRAWIESAYALGHRIPMPSAVGNMVITPGKHAPKVRVVASRGIIDVNSAILMRCTHDVVCVSLDLKQKYATFEGAMSDEKGDHGIGLGANEDTLGVVDTSLPWTEVWIRGLTGKWDMTWSKGRYYFSLVLVRQWEYDFDRPDVLEFDPPAGEEGRADEGEV